MQLDKESPHDKLRQSAWDKSFHAYATSYLFNKRRIFLSKLLRIITFLGIVIPLVIGAYVLDYGTETQIIKTMITWILSPIALVQLILSAWASVDRWNEKVEYYGETAFSNSQLSEDFKKLGEHPPENLQDLQHRYDLLQVIQLQRDQQDGKFPLSEKEKREGMRWALRKYQNECVSCKKIPDSMVASDCPVCGNF